jgi:hypothetical protein
MDRIRELGLKARRRKSALKGVEKINLALKEKAIILYDETSLSINPIRKKRSRYFKKNKLTILIAYDQVAEYGYYRIIPKPTQQLSWTQIRDFYVSVGKHDPRFKIRWIADRRFRIFKASKLILEFSSRKEIEYLLGFKRGVYETFKKLKRDQRDLEALINIYQAYLNWLNLTPI